MEIGLLGRKTNKEANKRNISSFNFLLAEKLNQSNDWTFGRCESEMLT